MTKQLHFKCLVVLVILCAGIALSQDFVPPRVSTYATDLTGTLSRDDLADLNSKLEAFDRQTSTQIVLLMLSTTGDYTVEEAALKVAEENKIGRKGKDNGILLFIAKDDRAVRIEVGYGLEGVLPDILAGQIVRNEIIPGFRQGDYPGGIRAGIDAIMRATRNEYKAEPEKKKKGSGGAGLLIAAAVIILFILMMNRRGGGPTAGSRPSSRRMGGPFIFFPPGGSWGGRGGSRGGGFGGFGGGGGGGFSGGGGSFGGGGASGHW